VARTREGGGASVMTPPGRDGWDPANLCREAEGVKWDPLLLGPAVDNSTAPA